MQNTSLKKQGTESKNRWESSITSTYFLIVKYVQEKLQRLTLGKGYYQGVERSLVALFENYVNVDDLLE